MKSGGGDQFAQYAGEVAKLLIGEPNKRLSSRDELRFGNHGSVSVDLKKGTIFDHSEEVGGGVLWLIERETGRKGREAVDWLREHGFHVEDRGGSAPRDSRPASRDSNRNYGPDDREEPRDNEPPMQITKTWDYVDEAGRLIFQVIRLENGLKSSDGKAEKTYRQRRPDQSKRDGWNWSTKDCRIVPYRLPELLEDVAAGDWVFVVEGEKAADRLRENGVPATTNPRGAGKWVPELNEYFGGAKVVVLPDNDPQSKNKKTGDLLFHEDGRPKFVGLDHAREVATHMLDVAKDVRLVELPGLPLKGDVVDWLDAGHTIDELYELVRRAPRFEREPFRSRFHAVQWRDLDAPGPEHEWLIKNLLTRGETAMAAGPSKSGKTFFVLALAMAVARGVDFFGLRTMRGGVIYQAGEGGRGLKKRMRAYRKEHGISLDDEIPFVLLPSKLDLYNSVDHTEAFIAEAKHWASTFDCPLELIIIDTWATASAGSNENDGKDVSIILERCNRISRETGACVLLVHHMNADGAKVRGHTSILANLENVLIVRMVEGMHDEENRQLREAVVDKNKDGESGQKLRFVLRSVIIGTDEDGDPVTSCVVSKVNGETSDAPVPERSSVSNSEAMFIRALEKATSDAGTRPPQSSGLSQNLRLVEWKRFVSAYDSIAFDGADTDTETPKERERRKNARNQALKRTGESLMRKGIIAREAPWVWLTGKPIRGYRRRSDEYTPPADHHPPPTSGGGFDQGDDTLWGDN